MHFVVFYSIAFFVTVAVVIAFFICWAPFHVQRLVATYTPRPSTMAESIKYRKVYNIVTYISGILYYISTTINPLLYNIMSNKFRDAFKVSFVRCCTRSLFECLDKNKNELEDMASLNLLVYS